MDYENIVAELRQYKSSQTEKKRHEQMIRQKKYSSLCSYDLMNYIRYRMGSLNPEVIKRILTTKFYEYELMKMIECLFESLIDINYNVPSNRIIQHFLELDKVIGANSAYGYAIVTDFENKEGLFITKISKGDPYELIHEAFIGMHIINKLRQTVPNFVYTIGVFDCSYPILSANNFVETWCDMKSDKRYIVYENVAPSKSLNSMLKTIDTKTFINFYLQILLALREAYNKYKFTHYDLHTENVLIRKLDKSYAIEYNTPRGKRYIETDQLAVIIDFGQSRAEINGVSYGYYGLESFGNLATVANPLFDAYKLLMFSLFTLIETNKQTFNEVSKLYSFFSNADVRQEVKKQRKLFFVLPPSTAKFGIDGYIDYVINMFPDVLKRTTQLSLLKSSLNEEQALNYLHLSHKIKLADFLDVYDLTTKTQRFNYAEYNVNKQLNKYANMLLRLNELINNFRRVPITASYEEFRESIDRFVTYVGVYDILRYYINIIYKLSLEYNDKETAEQAHSLLPVINSMKRSFLKYSIEYENEIKHYKNKLQTTKRSLSLQTKQTLQKINLLKDIEMVIKILER